MQALPGQTSSQRPGTRPRASRSTARPKGPAKAPEEIRDNVVVLALLYGSLAYAVVYSAFNYYQTFIDKKPFMTLAVYAAFLGILLAAKPLLRPLHLLLLFFYGVLVTVGTLSILLGTSSNMHFYFLSIGLGAPFLFRGNKLWTILGALIPLLLFVAIDQGNVGGMSLFNKDHFLGDPVTPNVNVIGAAVFLAPELVFLALYIDNLIRKITASEAESRSLLSNLVPDAIIDTYRQQDNFYAEQNEDAVVLFVDIVNFTDLCMKREATHAVTLLHNVFSEMDEMAAECSIEKIKTIGDCYMAASNVLDFDTRAFRRSADFALRVQEYSSKFNGEIRFRVGIAKGTLIAGAIGKKRIFFDVWGHAVNLAARLQHGAEPGMILCSPEFFESTKEQCSYGAARAIAAKGIGAVQAYPLLGLIR